MLLRKVPTQGFSAWAVGSKPKCSVLRGKLWLQPTCACSVAPSHSQGSSYTACSVCSERCFLFLCFSSWCSHCLQSLPAAQMWQIPSLKWANSKAIPLQSVLCDFTNQLSPLYQPQLIILHSEFPRHFICILLMTSLSTLLQLCFTPCVRIKAP